MMDNILEQQEKDLNELNSLLVSCNGSPYQILQINQKASSIEITKSYNELSSENQDNKYFLDKLDSAYKILSNQTFREIYDLSFGFRNDEESGLYQQKQLEETNFDNQINKLYFISFCTSLLSWPLSKVSTIVNSSKSIIKSSDVVKEIYQKRGIKGFYNGSTFIYMVSIGAINTVVDGVLYSVINQKYLPLPVVKVLDTIIPATVKHPQSLLLDLLNIAPLSLSLFDIIKKVMLGSGSLNKNWKGLFFGVGTGLFVWSTKTFIDYLIYKALGYIRNGQNKNPNSKIFNLLVNVMDNLFIRSSIITLLYLPLEIIRTQNARILMESYLNSNSLLPIAMNPVSIIIDLYKLNGVKRFVSGYLSQYLVVLIEEIGSNCDLAMVQINQELLKDQDVY